MTFLKDHIEGCQMNRFPICTLMLIVLFSCADVVERNIEKLNHEDYEVRVEAVITLGECGDERAIIPLVEALKEKSYPVQQNAITAIKNLGSKAADALYESSINTQQHGWREAAFLLGDLGDKRAIEPLIIIINSSRQDYKLQAARLLAEFGDTSVIKSILKQVMQFKYSEFEGVITPFGSALAPVIIEEIDNFSTAEKLRLAKVLHVLGEDEALEAISEKVFQGEEYMGVDLEGGEHLSSSQLARKLIQMSFPNPFILSEPAAKALIKKRLNTKEGLDALVEIMEKGEYHARISAYGMLLMLEGDSADKILQKTLRYWYPIGKAGITRLEENGWKPETDEEKVYSCLGKKEYRAVNGFGKETCEILYRDYTSGDYCLAIYALKLAQRINNDDLFQKMNDYISACNDKDFANIVMCYGTKEMQETAVKWAEDNGFNYPDDFGAWDETGYQF